MPSYHDHRLCDVASPHVYKVQRIPRAIKQNTFENVPTAVIPSNFSRPTLWAYCFDFRATAGGTDNPYFSAE